VGLQESNITLRFAARRARLNAANGCAGLLLLVLLASLGCSTGLLGREAPTKTSPDSPSPFYTGQDGLALLAAPGGKPIAHLGLHEKVLRYRVERGFAFVRVAKTGAEGWVDNGKLLWRVPASHESGAATEAPEPTEQPAAEATAEEPAAEATEAEASSPPQEPTPAPEAAPAPQNANPDADEADTSIFDPF
jgi:hypothetical protein